MVESSQSLLSPLGRFRPSRGGVCVCARWREEGPYHLQAAGLVLGCSVVVERMLRAGAELSLPPEEFITGRVLFLYLFAI